MAIGLSQQVVLLVCPAALSTTESTVLLVAAAKQLDGRFVWSVS